MANTRARAKQYFKNAIYLAAEYPPKMQKSTNLDKEMDQLIDDIIDAAATEAVRRMSEPTPIETSATPEQKPALKPTGNPFSVLTEPKIR